MIEWLAAIVSALSLAVSAVFRSFGRFAAIMVILFAANSINSSHKNNPPAAPKAEIVNEAPGQPRGSLGARTVSLGSDRRGHFLAGLEINGRRVDMLVDTGASTIALTAADAARAGQFPAQNDFRVPVTTANGTTMAAQVRLREVRLEGIVVRDVEALIMPQGNLSVSLLGMSFLRRLSGFQVANGKLVLTQ